MRDRTSLVRSWYYICDSAQLRRDRPTRLTLGTKEWVGYRNSSGKAVIQDLRCPHMGTDLSAGKICGGNLQCPLHRWEFDSNGQCLSVPGRAEIPSFARIKNYAVDERHGKVFVFNGVAQEFDLPFFEGEDPNEFRCARAIRLQSDCAWDLVSANAFDVYHFEQFHGRKLIERPRITHPHPSACRIQHRFEIVQPSMSDRLLILAGGKVGNFDYTSWRGSFVLLKAQFRSIANYLQIVFYPISNDRCGIDIFVLEKKSWRPKIPLFLKRTMTEQFFRPESQSLKHVRFNPATLVELDQPLATYMNWIKQFTGSGLRQEPAEDPLLCPTTQES